MPDQPARFPQLPTAVLGAMRDGLPALADRMVEAVIAEVPTITQAAQESWRPVMYASADQLLGALVEQLGSEADRPTSPPMREILSSAYSFGVREARQGRPTEVQLAAYRIGAREIWREWSALAVTHGMTSDDMSVFAELSFTYLDRVSSAAVTGHADEQARLGLDRQRRREQLVRLLLRGAPEDELRQAAEAASWVPPRTLTAVGVPAEVSGAVDPVTSGPRTLEVVDDSADLPGGFRIFLVSDVGGRARAPFLAALGDHSAVVGPARPWTAAQSSVRRVVRAVQVVPTLPVRGGTVVDTDLLLPELVVSADADALADLRRRVLTPLDGVPAAAADRLAQTLRSWLLHHGRREDIAAELFVSPSTIRYRLRQLRELFGDRLTDPRAVAELTIALAVDVRGSGSVSVSTS